MNPTQISTQNTKIIKLKKKKEMHKCRMREKKIKKKAQHTDRKFGVPPMNVNLPNVSIYTIVCIMLLYVCIK